MTHSVDSLNQMSLSAIRRLFPTLEPPEASSLTGVFRGAFVGPAWLRGMWGPLLALTGLGGWWGKQFDQQGNVYNLVYRQGSYQRVFPMFIIQQDSYLDHRPGLALRYRRDNPFPWPYILDEFRRLDPSLLLGMSLVDFGPLRRQAFPFTLQTWEAPLGR